MAPINTKFERKCRITSFQNGKHTVSMLTPNCFMATIAIKDEYFSVQEILTVPVGGQTPTEYLFPHWVGLLSTFVY